MKTHKGPRVAYRCGKRLSKGQLERLKRIWDHMHGGRVWHPVQDEATASELLKVRRFSAYLSRVERRLGIKPS